MPDGMQIGSSSTEAVQSMTEHGPLRTHDDRSEMNLAEPVCLDGDPAVRGNVHESASDKNGSECVLELAGTAPQKPFDARNTIISSENPDSSAEELHAASEPSFNAATPVLADEKVVGQRSECSEPVVLQFIQNRWGQWKPTRQQKLRNNLSPSVGFLEFANATDFAANVWNMIPVPIYAIVLMAASCVIAVSLSFFALRDGLLCWENVKLLRKERADLLNAQTQANNEGTPQSIGFRKSLETKIEVNRRELGQEVIDRFSMDVFMGFSSLLVGIGSGLAIGGANRKIFEASNLLSGYIGNTPSAIWGIANTAWCAYLFRRARRHAAAVSKVVGPGIVNDRLRYRTTRLQIHMVLMGFATLLSAPAGMLTVTQWWAYVVLILPCILAKWGNEMWIRRLGYSRLTVPVNGTFDSRDLMSEMEWIVAASNALTLEEARKKKANFVHYVQTLAGDTSITAFMIRIGLFEELCCRLLRGSVINASRTSKIDIDQYMVEDCEKNDPAAFVTVAAALVKQKGLRTLAYRERHLLELLGANLSEDTARAASVGSGVEVMQVTSRGQAVLKCEEKKNVDTP